MARTIPHRELRNNSSKILREVQGGETIEITNHGEVVATLIPSSGSPRDALRVRKAVRRGGFSTIPRVSRDHAVIETLDDLRGER